MQKAINRLTTRIEKLNKEFKVSEKISDNPELTIDYEFAINNMINIQSEIIELQAAISILKKHNATLLEELKEIKTKI